MQKLKKVRLRSKEERRFRAGHPWVFSNELQESPKSLVMGEVIELQDSGGAFLAYGFGNPHSLISFRELSRKPEGAPFEGGRVSPEFFTERFLAAGAFRRSWFSPGQSHRMIFGEADGLSGLIIDRFEGERSVVDVVQPHSAGMDLNLDSILEALVKCRSSGGNSSHFAILRRDASSREKEGIERFPVEVRDLKTGSQVTVLEPFRNFRFQVSGIMGSSLWLSADLVSGQKTGFFFDQLQNIRLLETLVLRKTRNDRASSAGKGASVPFRILDLCSYVGQWSTHLLQTLSERECLPAEFTCVDASAPALEFARGNLKAVAASFGIEDKVTMSAVKADVLEPLPGIPSAGYEIVIADPPAFIKNRKSIPQGKQAYLRLFQTAIEKTAQGGLVVCCSCSQLLSHEEFLEVLSKASRRSGRTVRWLAEGSPSFDHFTNPAFPEGQYLKCLIGQVDAVEP
jgi:23S rRNA (cytosine1962-C5)-methyltransferase